MALEDRLYGSILTEVSPQNPHPPQIPPPKFPKTFLCHAVAEVLQSFRSILGNSVSLITWVEKELKNSIPPEAAETKRCIQPICYLLFISGGCNLIPNYTCKIQLNLMNLIQARKGGLELRLPALPWVTHAIYTPRKVLL